MSNRADNQEVEFAGFWIRFLAIMIDGLILTAILIPVMLVGFIPVAIAGAVTESEVIFSLGSLILQFVASLIGVLYYVFLTSSKKQGTFGKRALGLIVVNEQGERVSNGKSFIRYLGSMVSSLLLYVGYIMIAFHPQKRGLHDIIAGTYVVKQPK